MSTHIATRFEAGGLRALERELAYKFACSVIEGNCVRVEHPEMCEDGFDLGNFNPESEQDVKNCALYLDLRGLLQRASTDLNWVWILDESEATT